MTHPARLTLEPTAKLRARLEAEAKARGMTVEHLCHVVLADFCTESEARQGARHECCGCRDVTPEHGVARCCWCARWLQGGLERGALQDHGARPAWMGG